MLIVPDIASDLAKQPHDVRWTTSYREPVGSFIEVVVTGGQLVVVSERFPVDGHGSQDRIVQAQLHDIANSAVEFHLQLIIFSI